MLEYIRRCETLQLEAAGVPYGFAQLMLVELRRLRLARKDPDSMLKARALTIQGGQAEREDKALQEAAARSDSAPRACTAISRVISIRDSLSTPIGIRPPSLTQDASFRGSVVPFALFHTTLR